MKMLDDQERFACTQPRKQNWLAQTINLLRIFLGWLLLSAIAAHAQTGTKTIYTGQFNNAAGVPIARTWAVYVPLVRKTPASVLWFFHGTAMKSLTVLPTDAGIVGQGWGKEADARGFIVVAPIATYSARCGCRFWGAWGAEHDFPGGDPGDSAFIVALIAIIDQQFGVGMNQYGRPLNFFTGFSSGAMFTNRVTAENALLVSAACPMSGTLWVGNSSTVTAPQAATPICSWHGDADTTLPYAGGIFPGGWGYGAQTIPSVDEEIRYWEAADGLPLSSALVTNAAPTQGLYRIDESDGVNAVQFVREIGYNHTETQIVTIGGVAEFLAHYGL